MTGSVEEANLDRYDLEVGFGDPPSVFVPLAGGTSVPKDATLAAWDLETLPDGHYTLRLSATDQAANFAIVETDVILDTTPTDGRDRNARPGRGRIRSYRHRRNGER